jgi:hypothetical protein
VRADGGLRGWLSAPTTALGKLAWVLVIAVAAALSLAVMFLLLSAGLNLFDSLQMQARAGR